MNIKSLGTHILIDYFECNSELINNKAFVSAALLDAARLSNATIVTDVFHTFNPHGISGVVVIAESHVAIHTWPEYACAAVDVFSCGDKMNPEVIEGFLKDVFQARSCESRVIERGRMLQMQDEHLPAPKVPSLAALAG
jgi:S-adenosylmethionine decarboxylase proenzyme